MVPPDPDPETLAAVLSPLPIGEAVGGVDKADPTPDPRAGTAGSDPAGVAIGRRRAAVAAVFTAGRTGTELLFIQRATVDGDPWSGQMAFPGGRVEPEDRDTPTTAEREAREELGLDLSPARRLGSLADVEGGQGTRRQITVSAHCYWLDRPGPLIPNREVADALWVPFDHLLDQGRYIDYLYPPADNRFPGIQLDHPEQVVWGLTLRLLTDLARRLDVPFIQ